MKRTFTFIVLTMTIPGIINTVSAQFKVKGPGSTSATSSLIVTNSNTPIDTQLFVRDDGRVGIGTTNPLRRLDVNGMIYSRSGGYQFPDGTIQTTAAILNPYWHVFTVSQAGGTHTTINSALLACTSPSPTNQYLIRVMPGVYNENFTCLKYVHMKGAGKYSTTVNGTVVGEDSCVIEDFYITHGIKCFGKSPTILHNIITNKENSETHGIHVTNGGDPWIKENEILDCTGWGIMVFGFGTDPWIIGNKILRNNQGGIRCENSSPTISNNFIDFNDFFGIFLLGIIGTPAEPTIDDNVIGHTDYQTGGIGIYMTGFAEPRIIANDIYLNECGIWINQNTQPSIIGNDINYNFEAGIRIFSNGASKRPVISFNHLHSNCHTGGAQPAGIWVQNSNCIITQNNISQNDANQLGMPDIDYSLSNLTQPTISLNVYDIIIRTPGPPGPPFATGQFNVTTAGLIIAP